MLREPVFGNVVSRVRDFELRNGPMSKSAVPVLRRVRRTVSGTGEVAVIPTSYVTYGLPSLLRLKADSADGLLIQNVDCMCGRRPCIVIDFCRT